MSKNWREKARRRMMADIYFHPRMRKRLKIFFLHMEEGAVKYWEHLDELSFKDRDTAGAMAGLGGGKTMEKENLEYTGGNAHGQTPGQNGVLLPARNTYQRICPERQRNFPGETNRFRQIKLLAGREKGINVLYQGEDEETGRVDVCFGETGEIVFVV